jgi:hypothetical protein
LGSEREVEQLAFLNAGVRILLEVVVHDDVIFMHRDRDGIDAEIAL